MSYKNRKLKKNRFNQLKRSIELIKIALLKKIKVILPKKEAKMLIQISKLTSELRRLNKQISRKNVNINDWVDSYLQDCLLNAKPVTILTQWCVAKDLEVRFEKQGQRFEPTISEKDLILKEIPGLLALFKSSGLKIDWWLTFNRSYLDMGRIKKEIEDAYIKMIKDLFAEASLADSILILNWEEEVLRERPKPSQEGLERFGELVPREAFEIDLKRHSVWALNDAKTGQSPEQLKQDMKFKVACEMEEGRLLCGSESPLGTNEFLLMSLELPERWVFFAKLAPEFRERIVSVLKPYPWRLAE